MDITEVDIKGCSIVPITPSQIDYGIEFRPMDLAEINKSHFATKEIAIYETVRLSAEAYAVVINGWQEALFGVSSFGTIWFIGSRKVFDRYRYEFLSLSSDILDYWQTKYGTLHNKVLAENTKAIEWLKGLGFTIIDDDNNIEWKYFRRS